MESIRGTLSVESSDLVIDDKREEEESKNDWDKWEGSFDNYQLKTLIIFKFSYLILDQIEILGPSQSLIHWEKKSKSEFWSSMKNLSLGYNKL